MSCSPVLPTSSQDNISFSDRWNKAKEEDGILKQMTEAVKEQRRNFPTSLNIKASIAEYSVVNASYTSEGGDGFLILNH
ncbi:hypothetical protein ACJ73_06959 [Blastomyces percursus]|uniref:Uncharacterized protein n=1 Tax=Blastomyces percursus TaxID=1658174 RepID=A0A1J9PZC7_9EURO|nr:hypothetical protein ACJ73_06959 [Blastomyces percursus]